MIQFPPRPEAGSVRRSACLPEQEGPDRKNPIDTVEEVQAILVVPAQAPLKPRHADAAARHLPKQILNREGTSFETPLGLCGNVPFRSDRHRWRNRGTFGRR